MILENVELNFYSELQIKVLQTKKQSTYQEVKDKFGFTNNTHIESFLFRTCLGFRLDQLELPAGPIPLVPQIVVQLFIDECSLHADELNCLYAHKALKILENLIADRAIRAYGIAIELNCPQIASDVLEKYENSVYSCQWFSHFCSSNGIHLQNAQTLEEKRQKFCHTAILSRFHDYVATIIHSEAGLIYNVDETYCSCNNTGKLVVPEGKNPFVLEDKTIGHITAVCCISAAGEALQPFFILPLLQNLPLELDEFWDRCENASIPSGWMTSNIFFIWALFFVSEVNKKKASMYRKIGNKAFTIPCLLFLDGHKSRINSLAIELFVMNNIRVIVFPAHTSHVIQPFDISVAAPLKNYLHNHKTDLPSWLEKKVKTMNQTAKCRYIMIVSLLDAWSQAATISNIKSGWESSGLVPFDKNKLLSNRFVRDTNSTDLMEPPLTKNGIQINSTEITTFAKRIEIARHYYNNQFLMEIPPFLNANQIFLRIKYGKDKILSLFRGYYLKIDSRGYITYIM